MLQALRRFSYTPAVSAVARGGGVRCFASAEIPKEAWLQPPTTVTTLPNGIRVATQKTFDETATVGVWIDAGSRYETKETNGAAHFLEHMAFKGTKRRSREQLEKEIENMGAHLNAYTAREQTVYYAKAFKEDTKQAMDILGDILLNSTLEDRAIQEEKGVILREMKEVEKSHEEVIFDRLHQTAFRDCALGYTILGPEENIRGMKREHLTDYIKKNYTADRMVIAAAGNVDHKEIVQLAEQNFGKLPAVHSPIKPPVTKPYFCGSELLYRNDEMGPIAHVAIGFEGVPWTSPDAVTFMVMQATLGSFKRDGTYLDGLWSGNKTIHTLSHSGDQHGAVEAYSAFNTNYKDTGLWGFYYQCEEKAVDPCQKTLLFGAISMAYSITEEEVTMGKNHLKTQLFGALDSTTSIAEDIGRQMLVYGRRVPTAELVKRIEAVDADEVRRVAWKYLHDAEIAITGIGPLHGLMSYYYIRRQTFWNRY